MPDGCVFTTAESFALFGTDELLRDLVEEQLIGAIRFADGRHLVVHDPDHGYVFQGRSFDTALVELLG